MILTLIIFTLATVVYNFIKGYEAQPQFTPKTKQQQQDARLANHNMEVKPAKTISKAFREAKAQYIANQSNQG